MRSSEPPSPDPADGLTAALDIADLAEWVAIPSVSRDAPPAVMLAAARWLADRLAPFGGRVEPTAGHPLVRAEWLGAPGAPTVLVYGHYDVQPPGDLAEWEDPPVRADRGRGPAARPRGQRRQGAGLPGGHDAGRHAGPRRPAAAQRQAAGRGRGGDRQPAPARLAARARRRAGLRSGHLRRRGDVAAHRAVAVHRLQGPGHAVGAGHRRRRRPPLGPLRRHGGQPGARPRAAAGLLALPSRGRRRPRLLRRHLPADRRAPRRDRRRRLRRRRIRPGARPGRGARRARVQHPGAAVGATHPGGQRDLRRRQVHGYPARRDRPCVLPAGAGTAPRPRPAGGHRPPGGAATARRHGRRAARRGPGAGVHDPARPPAIRAATAALEDVYPGEQVLLACIGGTLPASALFKDVLGAKTLFFSFSTADERLHAPGEFLRTRRLAEGVRVWERLWVLLSDGPHRLAPLTRGA